MVGTAIRRGPSPLGAGDCGGGWRPSPLGCTAALSTVGGCAMPLTASTRWPGGGAEPLLCPQCHLLSPSRERPCGSPGCSRDPHGVLEGLGRVPGGQLGPSRGPGGGLGESLGGLHGTSQGPGLLGRAPGRRWGEAGPFKGCWGGSGKPRGDHCSHIQVAFYRSTVRDPRTSPRSLSHPHSKKVSSQVTLCLSFCPAPLVLSLPLLRSHLGGTSYSQLFSRLNSSGSHSLSKRLLAMEHLRGPLLDSPSHSISLVLVAQDLDPVFKGLAHQC